MKIVSPKIDYIINLSKPCDSRDLPCGKNARS